MPIINFTVRSQDLDYKDDSLTDTRIARKTIRFERSFKMKYMKLLHIYHNINNVNMGSNSAQNSNTIIFCKISFLNGNNAVYYETIDGVVKEHNGLICLGETVKNEHETTFKDCYKVLHDGKETLYVNQPFTVEFYKLDAVDASSGNALLATYNSTNSHTIQPVSINEFRGGMDSAGQFISFTFEYTEDYTK